MTDRSDLADRLRGISEDLGDVSIGLLRDGLEGDLDAIKEEKTIARARRAVDKAILLLDPSSQNLYD